MRNEEVRQCGFRKAKGGLSVLFPTSKDPFHAFSNAARDCRTRSTRIPSSQTTLFLIDRPGNYLMRGLPEPSFTSTKPVSRFQARPVRLRVLWAITRGRQLPTKGQRGRPLHYGSITSKAITTGGSIDAAIDRFFDCGTRFGTLFCSVMASVAKRPLRAMVCVRSRIWPLLIEGTNRLRHLSALPVIRPERRSERIIAKLDSSQACLGLR